MALVWWAILLQRQNSLIQDLINENIDISTLDYSFETKQSMILGEAFVFGLALIIGIWLIYKSYNQTIKNEKNKSNFLLAVTHELKSPLTAISLNLQTIRRSKSIADQGLDNLDLAESETNRLNRLIENLLNSAKSDFSDIKDKSSVNLNEVIKEIIRETSIEIPYSVIGSPKALMINKVSIETILKNLIENAVKFSNDRYKVSIQSKYSQQHTEITIVDNADIIPVNERSTIFTKFYRLGDESTRKTKGVGLGLYLVDRLTKEINGDVTVTSHQSGNIFTLKVPND